ncbi:complex I assembly factor TMEM126B, mitochondrial isoform X1 [Fukomys damarensis]|uniref:Transmembrane protein 126B n=2 Tax=Fukomys damarensis TaxID=885580 RepID=A0A091DAX3_FUKDA|nr:complex I assembly factor TMEM126B, mitochondrial isoform X1 [Fukomys damarensis]KFO29259.1 Transmembrane protein 126B [Fukomys damarensis]
MAALGREAGADPKCTGQLPMRNGEAHEGMKTAVYTHAQSSSAVGDAKFRRPMVIDVIEKKFENLRKDKTLDLHGTVTLATAASFTGIVSNFVLRSSFSVTYDALKTYASLTALPFLSTIVTYKFLVIDPLYSGNISKENCVLRSSLVGLICGVVYPSALAFSKNGRLAVKYHTVPLPQKGRVLLHWFLLCHNNIKRVLVPVVFVAASGVLSGLQHYAIFKKNCDKTAHED